MKINLRTSILTLFAALLITVCSTILYVHHNTIIKFFIESSEQLLRSYGEKINRELDNFSKAASINLNSATNLIAERIIIPDKSPKFNYFLLQILQSLPEAYGIEWGDPAGNLYRVERSSKDPNIFINEQVSKSHRSLIGILNTQGQLISKPVYRSTKYDPRLRPWYQKAVIAKKLTISDVYLFYPFGQSGSSLGLSLSSPVYDKNKKLIGILAINTKLNKISEFISNLTITPNSVIFIFDNHDNLVAAKSLQNFSGNMLPKIDYLHIPWAEASFPAYVKNKSQIFLYNFNNVPYLAFYDAPKDANQTEWSTTTVIALPLMDIIGNLVKQFSMSIIIIVMVLVIGLLLVVFIASTMSKPMVKLAAEARSIKELKLLPIKDFKSPLTIKEMSDMQEAFNSMKQSLKSFIRYVPFALVKNLIVSGDIAHVGGENKTVTFLFSDITGFTSLSETIEPQKLMIYLSEYFEHMTTIILERNGTVDKYIGDAIMAFWNAPLEDNDHAMHACQSALLMCECLEKLNQHWIETGYPKLAIRIGINTGNATIGNVGSDDRLSYTAIGDSVNLTNRVEELNKLYKTTIMVTESTYQEVKDKFSFRLIDYVTVRGKHKSVRVYELISNNPPNKILQEYNFAFENAFTCYQQGNWQEALKLFNELLILHPNDQLLMIYIERCKNFQSNSPANWDGIWRLQ